MHNGTDRDLFARTMKRQPSGRFLYYCHFTAHMAEKMRRELDLQTDEDIFRRLGLFQWASFGVRRVYGRKPGWKPDFMRYYRDMVLREGSETDDNGVLHEPGSMYHFTHYVAPLRGEIGLPDVAGFPFLTMEPGSDEGLGQIVAAAKAEGKVTEGWVGHMYEDAWQIRGYEDFLVDMAVNHEISDEILDRISQRNLECAAALARAGVDLLRTGDDVAGQQGMIFGAERWRKTMKPRWKAVFNAVKTINPELAIWYHSDGNITEIIGDLIEIGVDILNPVQPECMDLDFLRREYGDRVVFDGTIGTQTVMPFGTPAQVRDTVRRMKDTMGADGGLILSPTHVLEPEVPVENVLAFAEACGENA